jgi:uncharacterized membrane protein
MNKALDALRDKWGIAIGTFLIYMLITSGIPNVIQMMVPDMHWGSTENGITYTIVASAAGLVVSLFISGPMGLGAAIFSLALSRNKEARVEQILKGFDNFGNSVVLSLLMALFVFLWTLLFIIPGIIAALSYSMAYYIMADNPSIDPSEAMDRSKKLMDGNKMDLFVLGLMFLGLAIGCLFTCGIGFLWLIPFINVTMAKFYDDLSGGEPETDPIIDSFVMPD